MDRLRTLTGIAALLFTAAALNVLVLTEDLFSFGVMGPVAFAAAAGVSWLGLTLITRAESERASGVYSVNAIVGSLVFLAICGTFYAFVKRLDQSWDLTKEGRRELASQTVLVLQGLKEDVDVTCFFVHGGDALVDTAQDKARRFLERCQEHTYHLNVEYVDPQEHPERVEALGALRLRLSGVGSVVLNSGTRTREIPLSDVMARLEEREFVNALINVSRSSRPKVYFLTGHGERNIDILAPIDGGSNFKAWLLKEGYQVAKHLIDMSQPSIPPDADLVVINGYRSGYAFYDIQALDEYMGRGGRILIMADPARVQDGPQRSIEQLRPWISKRLGLVVGSDAIVSVSTRQLALAYVPDFSLLPRRESDEIQSEGFRGSFNSAHPITRGLDMQMILIRTRSVLLTEDPPEGWSGQVILRTTPDAWAETDLKALLAASTSGESPGVRPDPDELQGTIPVAAAVTLKTQTPIGDGSRTRDARAVVIGDTDLAANGEQGIDLGAHSNFLLNTVAWLTENDDLIAIRATGHEDPPIILSEAEKRAIAWITALGPVQLVALTGVLVLWRRRKNR